MRAGMGVSLRALRVVWWCRLLRQIAMKQSRLYSVCNHTSAVRHLVQELIASAS
jgi:hypothetical protein